jgi:hypothetical protein
VRLSGGLPGRLTLLCADLCCGVDGCRVVGAGLVEGFVVCVGLGLARRGAAPAVGLDGD